MNIVLIGGSGFIGTRLSKRLSQCGGLDFSIVDKVDSVDYPKKCMLADVRSLETLIKTIPNDSVLVNLAAEHRDDVSPKSLYFDVNVGGAENICKVARSKKIKKIIFISSVAVYGFCPEGTDESGEIHPFNDYGKSKYLAEKVFEKWQTESPTERSLVIIRPTVVFGERNRGNVYNLLKQIASGFFVMVGNGKNQKSMCYVENVAAFIEHSLLNINSDIHIFNYVDKPDISMRSLVSLIKKTLGKRDSLLLRLPYSFGIFVGVFFDFLSYATQRKFSISKIRVQKFCKTTSFNTSASKTNFNPPISLVDGLVRTIKHEFIDVDSKEHIFYSE